MIDQEALAKMRAAVSGGVVIRRDGESAGASAGECPHPESLSFIDVPPQVSPTGKVMVRNVVVIGFEENQIKAIMSSIIAGVLQGISPRLDEMKAALASAHLENVALRTEVRTLRTSLTRRALPAPEEGEGVDKG